MLSPTARHEGEGRQVGGGDVPHDTLRPAAGDTDVPLVDRVRQAARRAPDQDRTHDQPVHGHGKERHAGQQPGAGVVADQRRGLPSDAEDGGEEPDAGGRPELAAHVGADIGAAGPEWTGAGDAMTLRSLGGSGRDGRLAVLALVARGSRRGRLP